MGKCLSGDYFLKTAICTVCVVFNAAMVMLLRDFWCHVITFKAAFTTSDFNAIPDV
jgi:hypothetical protein